MNSLPHQSKRRRAAAVFAYLLGAVTGALGLLNWIVLREALMSIVVNSSISRWSWQAIDQFSFLLFGMMWLSCVLFAQHYYVKGAERQTLWGRFSSMTGIQMLLLFLCHLIPALIGIIRYAPLHIAIVGAEGAAGAGMLLFGRYLSRKQTNRDIGKERL